MSSAIAGIGYDSQNISFGLPDPPAIAQLVRLLIERFGWVDS
jgi:hypothetical protein